MKSIVVYYFSGTGNTEKIVQLLGGEFEKNNCVVILRSVEALSKSQIIEDLNQYDLIGLAYPIYGFGTPDIISRLINQFPAGEGRKLFLLKTGADFISINHNASTELIEILEKKNFDVFYDRIIVMPPNWIISYDDRIKKQLYNCATEKVRHMCRDLLELKRRRYKTGIVLKKLSLGISHMEKKYGSAYYGKSLRANQNCNLCKLCVKQCPNQNINIVNETLQFRGNCLWCMRCVYSCPVKAIESKGMNFSILKQGYDLQKVLDNPSVNSDYIDEETTGYFKHFYKYLTDVSV